MSNIVRGTTFQVEHALESLDGHRWPCLLGATRTSSVCENIRLPFFKKCWAVAIDYRMRCWAEAHVKITRMTLTIKLDRNWSSFQLANSTPPLSVTGSAIAPSARMHQSMVTSFAFWFRKTKGSQTQKSVGGSANKWSHLVASRAGGFFPCTQHTAQGGMVTDPNQPHEAQTDVQNDIKEYTSILRTHLVCGA